MQHRVQGIAGNNAHGDQNVAQPTACLRLILYGSLDIGFADNAARYENVAKSHELNSLETLTTALPRWSTGRISQQPFMLG
jgi:hypothetical protein